MWAAALALLAALLAPLLPPSLAVPPAQATCSTAGPATRQLNTARFGGTVLSDAALPAAAAGNISAAAAICAERCCAAVYEHASETQPCRSWTVHDGNCSLRGLYSAPTELTGAVSGVVYRTGVQDERVGTIRGFNYVPAQNPSDLQMWRDYSEAVIECDMVFAQTAGFNFARVFLSYTVWSESNSSLFLGRLQHFVATAHSRGVQTMPVIFDPCYDGCKGENITIKSDGDCWYPSPKPSDMESEAWWSSGGQAFVRALVAALPPGTPGLAMWDAVNEPGHRASGLPFAIKVADYLREISPESNVTIGLGEELADPQQTVVRLEQVAPHVDILSFHSYHDSWELGLEITELALSVARKHNKSVFNSETGCIARASAFDQTMEMATRNGIGFAVWELMISDCLDCADTRRWKHGLLYTDGTTRDPAAIAAVRGIYLNRGDEVALAVPKTDVEHKPDHGLRQGGLAGADRQQQRFSLLGTRNLMLAAGVADPEGYEPPRGDDGRASVPRSRREHEHRPAHNMQQGVLRMEWLRSMGVAVRNGGLQERPAVHGHNHHLLLAQTERRRSADGSDELYNGCRCSKPEAPGGSAWATAASGTRAL